MPFTQQIKPLQISGIDNWIWKPTEIVLKIEAKTMLKNYKNKLILSVGEPTNLLVSTAN